MWIYSWKEFLLKSCFCSCCCFSIPDNCSIRILKTSTHSRLWMIKINKLISSFSISYLVTFFSGSWWILLHMISFQNSLKNKRYYSQILQDSLVILIKISQKRWLRCSERFSLNSIKNAKFIRCSRSTQLAIAMWSSEIPTMNKEIHPKKHTTLSWWPFKWSKFSQLQLNSSRTPSTCVLVSTQ